MFNFITSVTPKRVKAFLKTHLPQSFLDFLGGMPSRWRNVEYNRALWDWYARSWDKKRVNIENPDVGEDQRSSYLTYLGDEWGRSSDVDKIVEEYIYPYVTQDSVVAEIGVGGGRIASRVAGMVKELYALDISKEMLHRAQSALACYSNVRFILLKPPLHLPDALTSRCDFIYSFDVFVHLDLHTMWRYFMQIDHALKQGGFAFIHTTNLKAPGGWQRFSSQEAFTVHGHYFISPEVVEILAEHSFLKVTKTSNPDPTNFYFNRDYLVILEKVN
jgi:SAM-dependent methyltransferase